ncbi:hypothetical protein PR202_ga11219 [Eleusine coracana subsp. coracana]|uniref:Jacalin-type lectin domain-containing protein n=1 Tax=Eleusine coracana subsp. coracana TaxID=191504 RepID=A0AAV5C914_ELECO|nr:hypothetical protein PR202_ga11219 [Eleusine coracana subsp. coracana]
MMRNWAANAAGSLREWHEFLGIPWELHSLSASFTSRRTSLASMEGLVKIGPWGGSGDELRDIAVAPHRLESVVISSGWAVDSISFTYTVIDGTSHKVGQWGGSGGHKQEGRDGVVRSLTFVTNVGKHGPFGNAGEGTPFSVPVQNGGRVVGFFGRSECGS